VFLIFALGLEYHTLRFYGIFTVFYNLLSFRQTVVTQVPNIPAISYVGKYYYGILFFQIATGFYFAALTRIPKKYREEIDLLALLICGSLYLLYHIIFVVCVFITPFAPRRMMLMKERQYEKDLLAKLDKKKPVVLSKRALARRHADARRRSFIHDFRMTNNKEK